MDAKKIGRRLAQFRCAFNLSGTQAAAKARWGSDPDDPKRSGWSNCERGERVPEVRYINNLCDIYGLTLDWFYRGSWVGISDELHARLAQAAVEVAKGEGFRKKAPGRPPLKKDGPRRRA